MKKPILLLMTIAICNLSFAQLEDANSSNNGSMTLGTGTGTLYQFAGDQRGSDGTNQSQGGFGILSGAHQISPIVWMYGNQERNAFQIRRKEYNGTVQNASTLFHVGANGRIGIGTTVPASKFEVHDAVLLSSGRSLGSFTLGSGTGTLYEIAGSQRGTDETNQSQGGFGIISGSHQISPVIWMYGNQESNAFQVKKKNYNATVQAGTTLLHVGGNGRVGIGTATPEAKLTVSGSVNSREVKVTVDAGAYFVFHSDYKLRTLAETEAFINQNQHLPEIASAEEMVDDGLELGKMNIKLLQKVEELTLYLIEQKKEIQELQKEVSELKHK